jgi:hypothetical protein
VNLLTVARGFGVSPNMPSRFGHGEPSTCRTATITNVAETGGRGQPRLRLTVADSMGASGPW